MWLRYSSLFRKREADELEDVPDTKKPRLTEQEAELKPEVTEEELVEEESMVTEQDGEVDTEAKDEEKTSTLAADVVPATKPKREKKVKEGGGGSFKEHPYTFLPPDDPILLNCM